MSEQPQSYEQARKRLIEVVRQLESGDVPLSSAMELWQEGETLARTCNDWLDGARARVEQSRAPEAEESPESR